MSLFTQSVVRIARNIRASEYDALFAINTINADNHSGGGYVKLKKIVFKKFLQNVGNSLDQYGITEAVGAGLQIHHIKTDTHFIERGHKSNYYTELVNYINDDNGQLETKQEGELKGLNHKAIIEQIKGIVFIPKWLHLRCKNHKHKQPLNNPIDYYELMNKYLTNIRWFRKIKQLKFNNNSIHAATLSIQSLSITAKKDDQNKIIKQLKNTYDLIKQYIINQIKEKQDSL